MEPEQFCYPPLGSLLGDRVEDLPADGGRSLPQGRDTWQLQLEAAPADTPVHPPTSDAQGRSSSEWPADANQVVDLLDQLPPPRKDLADLPWRRAASPTRRAAEDRPKRDIPVKAPPGSEACS